MNSISDRRASSLESLIERRGALLAIAFLFFTIIAVYAVTLNAPFVFDDHTYIVNNPEVQDLSAFFPPVSTRYFGFLSFALNYKLGGLDTTGYHAVNIAIHAINSALLYLLVASLAGVISKTHGREVKDARLLGFGLGLIASTIFALHPIQTQAVTYTTQRFASLAAMFYLSSIYLYIRWRVFEGGQKNTALYVASIVLALFAQMTKEISFTLPVVIALIDLAFFNRGDIKGRLARLRLVPFFLLMAVIPAMIFLPPYAGIEPVLEFNRENQIRDLEMLSPYTYLVTQFRVIVTYLRLVVYPAGQNLDYDYPKYSSIAEPAVAASLVLLLLFLIVALYAYLRSRKNKSVLGAIGSAGVFWFFITLSIESSVIPIFDVIFEHRMYLPLAGLAATIAALIAWLASKARVTVVAFVAVAVVMGAILAPISIARNLVWANEIALYTDIAQKSPNKPRGLYNLALALYQSGRVQESIDMYLASLRAKPDSKTHYNLAHSYVAIDRIDLAAIEFKKAVDLNPGYVKAWVNLAIALDSLGRYGEARKAFEDALAIDPSNEKAIRGLEELRQKAQE